MYRVIGLIKHAAGISAMLAVLTTGASANLITNSDFEAGDIGFSSAYSNVGHVYDAKTYMVTSNPINGHFAAASYGDHTTGNGLMMAINGSDTAGDTIWSQTISVAAGTAYDFGAYISSWSPVNPAELDFIVNGTSIGTLSAPAATGLWELAFATWNSTTNTTAVIEIHNLNIEGGGNDFALDDLYFGEAVFSTEVPEPGVLAIFAFGLAGLALARRKKSA